MDPALEFLVNGLNMEFAIHLAADGHSIPDLLFVDILTEKCQLLHQHIWSYRDCLILVVNIGCTVATIKLFDKNKLDPNCYISLYQTCGIWKNNCTDYGLMYAEC